MIFWDHREVLLSTFKRLEYIKVFVLLMTTFSIFIKLQVKTFQSIHFEKLFRYSTWRGLRSELFAYDGDCQLLNVVTSKLFSKLLSIVRNKSLSEWTISNKSSPAKASCAKVILLFLSVIEGWKGWNNSQSSPAIRNTSKPTNKQ